MIETEETLATPGQSQGDARGQSAPQPAPSNADAPEAHELVIRPTSGWMAINWREM